MRDRRGITGENGVDETEKKKKNISTITKEAYKFKSQVTKVYLIFKFTMYSGGKKSIEKQLWSFQIFFYERFLITKFKPKSRNSYQNQPEAVEKPGIVMLTYY